MVGIGNRQHLFTLLPSKITNSIIQITSTCICLLKSIIAPKTVSFAPTTEPWRPSFVWESEAKIINIDKSLFPLLGENQIPEQHKNHHWPEQEYPLPAHLLHFLFYLLFLTDHFVFCLQRKRLDSSQRLYDFLVVGAIEKCLRQVAFGHLEVVEVEIGKSHSKEDFYIVRLKWKYAFALGDALIVVSLFNVRKGQLFMTGDFNFPN